MLPCFRRRTWLAKSPNEWMSRVSNSVIPSAKSNGAPASSLSASGRSRAREFSWERVTAKVDDYHGFVIRRLAARGELPEGFRAEIPTPYRPITRIA